MTRALVAALAGAVTAAAHMVSISTGEIVVESNQARYEIRVPLYEVAHVRDPERTLVSAVRFRSGGVEGRLMESRCRQDAAENALICEASYEFPAAVEAIEAASTLHQVTVPNHVHLLRATRGDTRDQAVLDLSFPRTELRFRPPTTLEIATRQSIAGALRAAGGPAQWLFLIALVIAARTRREMALLAAMLVAGEAAACAALPLTGWAPAPRFVEVACALTIAYLAVEALWLPQAGQRWLVVAVLGLFHGLYFAIFIRESEYGTGWVLGGAFLAELALLAALGWVLSRVARALAPWQPARAASAALLVTGLAWFFWRLRG
jgi:hypothetical protein